MKSSAAQNRRRIREGHLTPEQLQAVFAACERVQDRLLLRLAYTYGLRATEAATLLVKEIDIKQGTIEVNRLKKSDSATLPLLPELVDDLKAWLKLRPESRFLFPAPYNSLRSYTRWNVYRAFRQAAERAGLPRQLQHPHVLKHSIATHLLERGGNMRAVQKWIGHRSIQTTAIYAEVTGTMLEATADLTGALLSGDAKKGGKR